MIPELGQLALILALLLAAAQCVLPLIGALARQRGADRGRAAGRRGPGRVRRARVRRS